MTHSIPDACALALRTPQGVLVHSGDFKLDAHPVAGPPADLARLAALGREGVRLLLSDSTNADRPGRALPEAAVGPPLAEVIAAAPGRVFVATFSSNVHRMQQVVNGARGCGRRLALLGRGMMETFALAKSLGLIEEPHWMPVTPEEARGLPPRELCVLTTGTQGEPRSALSRLARGEHPELRIAAGDTVVLSARTIPGSELQVGRLFDDLCRRGATLAGEGPPALHASGHAHEEEQRQLLRLLRPERFVPIHGTYRLLARHLGHAVAEGVPKERCHLLSDGQVLELDDAGARVLPERVPHGRVYAVRDELGQSGVPHLVVQDRRLLAEGGLCLVVLAVARSSGAVVRGPELFGVGVDRPRGGARRADAPRRWRRWRPSRRRPAPTPARSRRRSAPRCGAGSGAPPGGGPRCCRWCWSSEWSRGRGRGAPGTWSRPRWRRGRRTGCRASTR